MSAPAKKKVGRPRNAKTLRGPTDAGRRKIASLIARGKTRGEVAAAFGVTILELRKHYDYELKLAESALRQELSVSKRQGNVRANSRFTSASTIPANCKFPPEMLAKVIHRIAKFDELGNPCDARGNHIFGKKETKIAEGKRGFRGTPLEADSTVSGIVRTSRQQDWDCSFPEWESAIMLGKSLVPKKIKRSLNNELAQKAVRIFKTFRLADVPGTPTLAEAGGEWLFEIVEVIIGSYDSVTKRRMLNELFLLVPKKNMKTTGGALIMLLLLIYNERPNGEAIMTAPVHDVAEIAFKAIAGAIELDADLSRIFEVQEHYKTVTDLRNNAKLSVMTFDPATLTGQKLFAALIDELHVIAKNPKAASALRQIRGGMLPFPEAILIFITTQAEEAPEGVFAAELSAARAVRDGRLQGGKMLPILYEFPEAVQKGKAKQSWRDPALWRLVTPNLGRSIALDALVSSMASAEAKGEGELRAWASQHLNIEIGVALRSNAWTGAEVWSRGQQDPSLTLKTLLERSEVVEIGIDGGGLDDLLALAVVGREKQTQRWLVWTKAWAHSIAMERSSNKPSEVKLQDLQKLGELTVVKKPGDDVDELLEIVEQCVKSGLLDKIGLDPYGVGGIVDALLDVEGLDKDSIVGVSQGWKLSGVVKTLERALAEGKLVHGNQALLNWCVGNAQVEVRGNASLITKAASGAAKIDALMAVLDAVHLIAANPPAKSKKYQMFVLGARGGQPARKSA